MTWKQTHDCGCGKDHDRDRDHGRDFGKCHGCKGRRTVIVQCCCGKCLEVQRHHCSPCQHLFKHHFDKFHGCGCSDW